MLDSGLEACDPWRMEGPAREAPVWSEEVRARSYDVDATRRMTGASLCRYFLEAAWNHAEALGCGFEQLREQGKFWVLSRMRWEVREYPAWGARTRLLTWPRGIESVFAMRDFEVLDEFGGRLAAGSSGWLVVDSNSKRPQRLHKVLPDLAAMSGRSALGRDPEKLPEHEVWERESAVAVRYTDIDVNQHANASRYIGWMLDGYPAGFHGAHRLAALEVNYLGETMEGESLALRSGRSGAMIYEHSLSKAGGGEVCRARFEWDDRF